MRINKNDTFRGFANIEYCIWSKAFCIGGKNGAMDLRDGKYKPIFYQNNIEISIK